jgi:flagellar biosynthesis protein FlhF
MKYVKIKAKNYNEALMKLRMDHGEDAIPISHKYVKEGGFLNSKILGRELVELTAAIPERKSSAKQKAEAAKSTIDFTVGDSVPLKSLAADAAAERTVKVVKTVPTAPAEPGTALTLADILRKPAAEEMRPPVSDVTQESGDHSSIRKLEKDFHDIRITLERLLDSRGRDAGRTAPRDETENDTVIKPYMDMLLKNDYDREECMAIMEDVRNSVSPDDFKDRYKIEKTLRDLLKSRIVTTGPIKKGSRKKVIMFVGPTGVGKTTTMAKLGALFSLRENYKIAFVTIDTYRIAATEQLKKYAEIMKIPIYVVNDRNSFKEIVENEKAEMIMVDTSGRNHRNDLKISEIKGFADILDCDVEMILCVSASTKKGDLANVFKSFDRLNFSSVIVTKVDETSCIGNVIDVAEKHRKPISYFTNGQEVPNDIDVADPEKMVNLMIGSIN